MSGPKCSTSSPSTVSLDEYRNAQKEAAQREIAQRLSEQRQLSQARTRVDGLIQDHSALRARVDRARGRLPDLTYVVGDLPDFPTGDRHDVWQAYASSLEGQIEVWRVSAESAIVEANRLQVRRERRQKAWELNQTLSERLAQHENDIRDLAGALGETCEYLERAFSSPEPTMECEDIDRLNEDLRAAVDALAERVARYRNTLQANENLKQVIDRVSERNSLVDSAAALAKWRSDGQSRAQQEFEQHMSEFLADLGIAESDLPLTLRSLLADIRLGHRTPGGIDFWARLFAFERRTRQRATAIRLLATPPLAEDDDLLENWAGLRLVLDQAAMGLIDLVPSIERSHEELHRVAMQRMAQRYRRLAFVNALHEAGLVEVAGDDMHFEDEGDGVEVFTLPGFDEYRVMARFEGDDTHWIPFRENDRNERSDKVRDIEFDNIACAALTSAVSDLNAKTGGSFGPFEKLKASGDRVVLGASEMAELGLHVKQRKAQSKSLKQAHKSPDQT